MARGVYSEQDETLSSASDGKGSLGADVRRLLADARAVLGNQLHLLVLETQRAARALALMAAFGVAAGMLLAGTCLGLGAALAMWLIEQGLRPSAALLAASLVALVCAVLLVVAMQRASVALTFPATRNSLRGASASDSDAAETAP